MANGKTSMSAWLAGTLPQKQMSEAFINSVFLAMSGGFQDAYTYFTRNKVFSNAQTGNVVLMSEHFIKGEWQDGLKYLVPLFAFAAGVFVAEQIQAKFRLSQKLHWRQGILLIEILILILVGFMPEKLNMLATVLVSFSDGYSYASTMCIGNLRNGTASLSMYLRERKPGLLKQALYYFGIILFFAIGAGLGGVISIEIGYRAIWVSGGLLLISTLLMFLEKFRGKLEEI